MQKGARRRLLRSMRDFLLLGILGVVPASVVLAWGIARSTASNASILALTIPVLMTCMGVFLVGERFTARRLVVLLFALAGTVLLWMNDLTYSSFGGKLLVGNAAIFLGGVGSAFLNTHSKDVITRFSELELLIYSYIVAIAACAVMSLFGGEQPFYRIDGYPRQAWTGVLVLGWNSVMGVGDGDVDVGLGAS